jgi:hypothetical protein
MFEVVDINEVGAGDEVSTETYITKTRAQASQLFLKYQADWALLEVTDVELYHRSSGAVETKISFVLDDEGLFIDSRTLPKKHKAWVIRAL